MVKRKIEIKRIEKDTSRQVTFSKRRNGLLKKAFELSVLCDAEVAVIIFSQKGRIDEFSSSDMHQTIERFHKHVNGGEINMAEVEQHVQHLKHESATMAKKIEILEASQRKYSGNGLDFCSVEELQEISSQLGRSLCSITERKAQLYMEQLEQLKGKERFLLQENAQLCEECGAKPLMEFFSPKRKSFLLLHAVKKQELASAYVSYRGQSSMSSGVETELFIGSPIMRADRIAV